MVALCHITHGKQKFPVCARTVFMLGLRILTPGANEFRMQDHLKATLLRKMHKIVLHNLIFEQPDRTILFSWCRGSAEHLGVSSIGIWGLLSLTYSL